MISKKRILQMKQDELRAVIAIVVPGRKADILKLGDMQEICIKWLFGNGLSINHIFELHEDEETGQIYCIMRNSEPCSCCPKAFETATLSDFDRGPIGNDFKRARTPSPSRNIDTKLRKPEEKPKSSDKVSPITVQPTIIEIDPDNKKNGTKFDGKDEKENVTKCEYCKRECGYCIVQLCSQV